MPQPAKEYTGGRRAAARHPAGQPHRAARHFLHQNRRSKSHQVHVVDQYDGRVFDDYDKASAHAQSVGYPALMERAVTAVENHPDGFIAAGFSNGGAMAEYVATKLKDRLPDMPEHPPCAPRRVHHGPDLIGHLAGVLVPAWCTA